MNNNIYGTVKQAQFDPSTDVDIFYYYRPTRSSEDTSFKGFKKIDNPSTILEQSKLDTSSSTDDLTLPGMYTLKLPVSIFANTGIYTIYIVPKEIECTIKDIGVLTAYPDIKGIVIDTTTVNNPQLFGNDNLVGYQVSFYSDSGTRQDYFRIITTSTFCEPVSQGLSSTSSSSSGYRYNENGSYSFLTVTPSTSSSYKSNATPYIGTPEQKITIKNTKFDPVCVEIEITEHDIETVSYMLEGEQLRNYENGRVTTYNFNGEIYKQFEFSTIKDNYTNTNIAELKQDVSDNVDNSLDINSLKN